MNPDINPPTLTWTNVSIYSQIFTPTQTHTMHTFVYGTDAWKTANAPLPLPNEDSVKPQKQGRWKSQANCSIYIHNVCGGPKGGSILCFLNLKLKICLIMRFQLIKWVKFLPSYQTVSCFVLLWTFVGRYNGAMWLWPLNGLPYSGAVLPSTFFFKN